jgi:hypothetical protein
MQDGQIITTSPVSLQLPAGETVYRPGDTNLPAVSPSEGMIRYNVDLEDMEAFIRGTWERVRTVRPATIAVQNLGNGDYSSFIFGPLNPDYEQSYLAGSQNIMTYIDNVYQIPETNYTVISTPPDMTKTVTRDADITSSTLVISGGQNIIDGMTISAPGLMTGTTVVQTYTYFTTLPFTSTIWLMEISIPTETAISSGTSITFTFDTGTYLAFAGAVPAKPVVALLGFDGYFPPS